MDKNEYRMKLYCDVYVETIDYTESAEKTAKEAVKAFDEMFKEATALCGEHILNHKALNGCKHEWKENKHRSSYMCLLCGVEKGN